MEIFGYKSFDSKGINQSGEKLMVGNKYHCDGNIKYNHNGYHFSTRFEDTIVFSDKVDENGNSNSNLLHDVVIAEVIGSGMIDEVPYGYSNYYGYYDMYACSDIEIIRYIPREELIFNALQLTENRMIRFVSGIKLTEEEIKLFENIYPSVNMAIDYYQRGKKDTYHNRDKYYKLHFTK